MARPKKAGLSKKSIELAEAVIRIIAPHVPIESLTDIAKAETVVNYGWEQAQTLQKQLQFLQNANNPVSDVE